MWIIYVFYVLCLLRLCARLFIVALLSPAGKGLTSWLSFVVSNCEFVHFSIGILGQVWYLMHRFLVFAPLLTLNVVLKSVHKLNDQYACICNLSAALFISIVSIRNHIYFALKKHHYTSDIVITLALLPIALYDTA